MLTYRGQLMAEILSNICTKLSLPERKWLLKWNSLSAFFPLHFAAVSVFRLQEPRMFQMNLIKYQEKKCTEKQIEFDDEAARLGSGKMREIESSRTLFSGSQKVIRQTQGMEENMIKMGHRQFLHL